MVTILYRTVTSPAQQTLLKVRQGPDSHTRHPTRLHTVQRRWDRRCNFTRPIPEIITREKAKADCHFSLSGCPSLFSSYYHQLHSHLLPPPSPPSPSSPSQPL